MGDVAAPAPNAELLVSLTGALVRLEPLGQEHEAHLWQAAQDTDWTWMPVDAGVSREAFRRWFAAELARGAAGTEAPFATIWRQSGRAVGATHYLEIRREHRRLEIGGTWLTRRSWGSGANVEAKLLLLEHAFALGYQRVEFKAHPDNLRSRRALEALPAQFEGVFRKHLIVRGGQPRDSAYYSVVDADWPAVRAKLERRLKAHLVGKVDQCLRDRSPASSTVAVIGLGAMGSRIAARLLFQGHEVVVWNRTRAKLAPLVDAGAAPADSPADAADRAKAVITMVADPAALRAVTDGPRGVIAGLEPGTTMIEMSTVGPAALSRLAGLLPAEVGLLDAPVLGSLPEAEAGSLAIFVGGPEALVERWTPLLSALGLPRHVGPLGSGAAAKLVANSTLFGVLGVLGEALALAQALGLSRQAAFEVLATTPVAAAAERRRPAIENDDYPRHFPLFLARKDAELIVEAAIAAGVDLAVADVQRRRLGDAEDAGWGERDYSAVLAWTLRAGANTMRPDALTTAEAKPATSWRGD